MGNGLGLHGLNDVKNFQDVKGMKTCNSQKWNALMSNFRSIEMFAQNGLVDDPHYIRYGEAGMPVDVDLLNASQIQNGKESLASNGGLVEKRFGICINVLPKRRYVAGLEDIYLT